MIKSIILIGIFIFNGLHLFAQNSQGKLDDAARIVLTSVVSDQIEGLTPSAQSNLLSKLNQITTKCGMGGSSLDQRFIITANVVVLTKDITPTAPPMHAYTLDVGLYIGDGIDGTLFSSTSVSLKGVGETETKAYMAALKNLKTSDPRYQTFLEEGKNKIVAYYNSKCDFILQTAETNANQKKFEEALAILSTIPEVCKECFDKAQEKSKDVFKRYIDNKCAEDLTKANAAWATFNDSTAISYLSQIFPDAKCYNDALSLIKQIKDHKCAVSMGKAKGAWATMDAQLTAQYLSEVSADSKCAPEAKQLASNISSKLKADAKAKWEMAYEKYNRNQVLKEDGVYHQFSINNRNMTMSEKNADNQRGLDNRNMSISEKNADNQRGLDNRNMAYKEKHGYDLEKAKINASRDVGVAWGKNQPKSVTHSYVGWW